MAWLARSISRAQLGTLERRKSSPSAIASIARLSASGSTRVRMTRSRHPLVVQWPVRDVVRALAL
jgi:hypothetical protein